MQQTLPPQTIFAATIRSYEYNQHCHTTLCNNHIVSENKETIMSNALITLEGFLSSATLPRSREPQLIYALVEASPQGTVTRMARQPLNLCLVLDRSSSMRGDRLFQVKEAARQIVDQMEERDTFSLVTFNDRADVVIPAQQVRDKTNIKAQLSGIEAAGGTEMANGLELAYREIQRPLQLHSVSRLIVLTDGRTYGDEAACLQVARLSHKRNIGITALGVGEEWNEDLLETMTASENSHARYITDARDIPAVFAEEIQRIHSAFAQKVHLLFEGHKDCSVRSCDRVRPFISAVPLKDDHQVRWLGNLGDWPGIDVQAFLIEMIVPPLPTGTHNLLNVVLRYTPPGTEQSHQSSLTLDIAIETSTNGVPAIDVTVRHWLERLIAYRLQVRAWESVEQGRVDKAVEHLQMAGTRLLSAGEPDLARTMQSEATRLLQLGNASAEGRKRIKYGTRGLMTGKY